MWRKSSVSISTHLKGRCSVGATGNVWFKICHLCSWDLRSLDTLNTIWLIICNQIVFAVCISVRMKRMREQVIRRRSAFHALFRKKKRKGGHRSFEFHILLLLEHHLCSKLRCDSQHYECLNEPHASGVYLDGDVFIYCWCVFYRHVIELCFSTQRSFCHCWQSLEVVFPWGFFMDSTDRHIFL